MNTGDDAGFSAADLENALRELALAANPALPSVRAVTQQDLVRLARDEVGVDHQIGTGSRTQRLVSGQNARWAEDVRWLTIAGYVAARVYGIGALTPGKLATVRRAMDVGREALGARIERWSDLQALTRLVRGDPAGTTLPVTPGEIAVMLHAVETVKHQQSASGYGTSRSRPSSSDGRRC